MKAPPKLLRSLAADALGGEDRGHLLLTTAVRRFAFVRNRLDGAGLEEAFARPGDEEAPRPFVFTRLRRGGMLRVYLDPRLTENGRQPLVAIMRRGSAAPEMESLTDDAIKLVWRRVRGDLENVVRALLLFERARRTCYELAETGTRMF